MQHVIDFSGRAPDPSHYPPDVIGAVRYVSPRRADGTRRPKCITEAELDRYRRAGRKVGFVFEDSALNADGGAAQGDKDGKRAAAEMIVLGVPPHIGVAVYAAVDHDQTSGQLPTVAAYLDAFHRHTTAAGYRRGVYGEFDVVRTMLRDGHAELAWQTVAWSNHQHDTEPGVVLYQRAQQITLDGTPCDVNDVLAVDWGQWDFSPHHPPEEDDMTDAERQMLTEVHQWLDQLVNGVPTYGIESTMVGETFAHRTIDNIARKVGVPVAGPDNPLGK